MRLWFVLVVVLGLAGAACSRSDHAAPKPEAVPAVDWKGAVALAERITGATAAPMDLRDGLAHADMVMFRVDDGLAVVERHRSEARGLGAYLFLADHNFKRDKDVLGLTETTDKFEVIRRVGTDGANYGHDTEEVIAWLREIERDEPFEITGVGLDFVEGFFTHEVQKPRPLAHRIHTFCPDFVNQGLALAERGPHAPPEDLIVGYFARNRAFFFWWD